jgi:peptidoglycan DL-endopeptidase CwlO
MTDAGGEMMATKRQFAGTLRAYPWWRPLACSAAATAAIAALFSPIPALAAPSAPNVPAVPAAPAVPDSGSRPIPLGTLTMPGQSTTPTATTPATTTTTTTTGGVATTPLVAKIEARRADIAALGDKLIKLGQDRELARQQLATADQKVAAAQAALTAAQRDAATAAANAMRDAAALPPGTIGTSLQGLDALAAIQRGESPGEEAAGRQLAIAQAVQQAALAEQATAAASLADLSSQYDKLNAGIAKKQVEQQKLEQRNADALTAADAAESAADAQLGAKYLAGANAGRGADQRAIAAVEFALAQRGDWYLWSAEGPDRWDCSGLVYGAYRSAAAGNFPLARVSRDQYWQTRNKVVDRYSLLPGDLLFFSSTNSWTGIHHVAMYAGNGMMVEAPRTGLQVRLVPVRWSRLFQATRVYGSVDGQTGGPDLGSLAPDPQPSPTPTPKPTSKPPTTKPTTKPPTTKPTTKPPTTKPTTKPPSSAPPSSKPPSSAPPTTPAPAPSTSSSSASGSNSAATPTGSSPTGSTAQSAATEAATAANSGSGSTSGSTSG